MLKRFLIVGAILGTSLLVAGTGAVLGVVLGTRTLVVTAASMKTAALGIAPTAHLGNPRILVASVPRAAD